jgi:hypothetical protein
MRYRLNAKYAFAFGIDLQSQVATMELEDRQIIRMSLDRDFPFRRSSLPFAIFRTMFIAGDVLIVFRFKGARLRSISA